MPLSRLSPRSSRTGLARQRSSSSQHADSQRHLQLWAAIRKTCEELELWQRQIDQVETLFRDHIVPRERDLTDVMNTLTERLIQHFPSTELDIPCQSLLGLWIIENLNALQDHPFGEPQRTHLLNEQWLELLSNDGPVESQLARLARRSSNPASSDKDSAARHSGSSDANAHDTESGEGDAAWAGRNPDGPDQRENSAFENDNSAHTTHGRGQKPGKHSAAAGDNTLNGNTAEKIQSLEDKLSVERLFRQLAKVLHPDREQDEAIREQKHVLMSQCLKARQEKNINALLTLYCEHVGELPDDLNDNSHVELINALETQLKELQLELREKRFGDPLQSMIVERYASSDNADSERRIQRHAQSLDDEITQARLLVGQLDTHEGLLDALDERRSVELDRLAIKEMTGQGS